MTSSATSSAEPAAADASAGAVEVLKPLRTTEAAGPKSTSDGRFRNSVREACSGRRLIFITFIRVLHFAHLVERAQLLVSGGHPPWAASTHLARNCAVPSRVAVSVSVLLACR